MDKSIIEEMWRDTIAPYYFDNSQGRYQVEPVVTDWIKTGTYGLFWKEAIQQSKSLITHKR